jgi:formylglycine-generating enzyme required for sulfatase activity
MRKTTLGKSALLAPTAAWVLAVVSAAAVEVATPEARFAAADLNEDGVLTGKERQAGAPYDDLNGDGVTSRDEFLARRNEEVRVLADVVAAREADEAFRRADVTEDGLLSGKERAGSEQADTDADGRITLAEFRAGRAGRPSGGPTGEPPVAGDGIGVEFLSGRGGSVGGSAGGTTLPDGGPPGTTAPLVAAGPDAAKETEEARGWFRALDENEDERLTGIERLGSEDFDTDGNGRVVVDEFVVGVGRLQAAENAKTAKAPTTAEPAGRRPTASAPSDLLKQFDAGKVYLRLLGVSNYAGRPLRCGTLDLRRVTAAIPSNEQQLAMLYYADDLEEAKRHSTKHYVELVLRHQADVVTPSDLGLFYFSGCVIARGGVSYLCPSDFDVSRPEATGIALDDVARRLTAFPTGRKYLVLDLHPYDAATSSDEVEAAAERTFAFVPNLVTLINCVAVDPDTVAGPFAVAAAEAVAGGADFNRDDLVDHDEWFAFQRIAMSWHARNAGAAAARPPLRVVGSGEIGSFGVVRVKARAESAGDSENSNAPSAADKQPKELINSLDMPFKYLTPMKVACGSPDYQAERRLDEKRKVVHITKGFYIGEYEVTQAEFRRVMARNPSHFQAADGSTDRLPVEQVTWFEAAEFCRRLSLSPVERIAGRTYRLPTECEWEYACSGGTDGTPFHYGHTITSNQANIRGDRPYGDSPFSQALGRTSAVGSYGANEYGLRDMHGNVAEWCRDGYAHDRFFYYTDNDQVYDFLGPETAERRVARGGDFQCEPALCRTAARRSFEPEHRFRGLGFRVVCFRH